jgi:hypothetical protein
MIIRLDVSRSDARNSESELKPVCQAINETWILDNEVLKKELAHWQLG